MPPSRSTRGRCGGRKELDDSSSSGKGSDCFFGPLPAFLTGSDKTLSSGSKVMMQNTKTNNTCRQRVPSLLDDLQAIIPYTHPPQPFQPTDRAFHHPADLAQSATVDGTPFVNLRLDPKPRQQPAGRLAVVAGIGIQRV